MFFKTHKYEPLTETTRPQDPTLDGSTLSFETMEHGGHFPDTMPQAIRVTDANGNWCVYEPISVSGRPVRSHGFLLEEK